MASTTSAKFDNDASKSKLGDIYQYIIALEHCLTADETDTVYIEQHGDVASGNTAVEVKFHEDDNHSISNNHIDFWKTLKNWVSNVEVINNYDRLLLLTTSKISETSKLFNWNNMTKEEKYSQLIAIKDKYKGATVAKYMNCVFDFKDGYDETTLLSILDKFSIDTKQPNIEEKVKLLIASNFFRAIPPKNRKHFLQDLLAYVIYKCVDNAGNWLVRMDDFSYFAQRKAMFHVSGEIPIPTIYKNYEADLNEFKDYKFVLEIKKINMHHKIKDAVDDYNKAFLTTIAISDNDPDFVDRAQGYQDEILKDLENKKELISLIHPCENKDHVERNAKICFIQSLEIPLKRIDGYDPNQDFFQRGTIHRVVNVAGFTWI